MKTISFSLALLAILLSPSLGNGQVTTESITEANFSRYTERLEHPATRLSALAKLIGFASTQLYQAGSVLMYDNDPKIDALKQRVVRVVRQHTDLETVKQALGSDDRTLQFWGVWFWRKGAFQSRDIQPNIWLSLIPSIERLSGVGDANVRLEAIQGLQMFGASKTLLAERLKTETSASNVLRLLDSPPGNERSRQLTPYLLRFLNHQDSSVRCEALSFIALNHLSASMRQVDFDESVLQKVREMTQAESDEERKIAALALKWVQEKPSSN